MTKLNTNIPPHLTKLKQTNKTKHNSLKLEVVEKLFAGKIFNLW